MRIIPSLFAWASVTAAVHEDSFSVTPEYAYSNEVARQTIINNQTFGNSWTDPSNTSFTPDTTDFNRVVLELRVDSTGMNFDRFSQLYIDDIEIWRSSTAEPDNHGMSWTVYKDVSHYGELFKDDCKVNFLIQNRVTNTYTGLFYVTLTAHFYDDEDSDPQSEDGWILDLDDLPNDVKALTDSDDKPGSTWHAPDDNISVSVGPLDRSTNRAVVHVFASGSGEDEFWWDTKHSSPGPSRFVDVYVGDQLAGFAAPYPTIFTGGVDPNLWRPLVDLRTLDLPAYFIDITPFLPTLWDESTEISVKVSNGVDDSEVPSSWIISYNLLTWSTSGQENSGTTNDPTFESSSPSGDKDDTILVERNLTTSASLTIGGKQQDIKWEQKTSYNNTIDGSDKKEVWQTTSGWSEVSGLYDYTFDYSYPFQCEMDNKKFYRVQQSYDVTANEIDYSSWMDTSVTQDSGSFDSSEARQYFNGPNGSHFAHTENMEVVSSW